jgi:hypothetical protein
LPLPTAQPRPSPQLQKRATQNLNALLFMSINHHVFGATTATGAGGSSATCCHEFPTSQMPVGTRREATLI